MDGDKVSCEQCRNETDHYATWTDGTKGYDLCAECITKLKVRVDEVVALLENVPEVRYYDAPKEIRGAICALLKLQRRNTIREGDIFHRYEQFRQEVEDMLGPVEITHCRKGITIRQKLGGICRMKVHIEIEES